MHEPQHYNQVFTDCTAQYQRQADPDADPKNPFDENTLEYLLYQKSWTDNVQWDLEDLIRDPHIIPEEALKLKRRIDASNQVRTDLVEKIDDLFLLRYEAVHPAAEARLNTESIAWALDRLSILALKIFHMGIQTKREDVDAAHRIRCQTKLNVLLTQQQDLIRAIGELMEDIQAGKRIFKVYRQMKMYNDPTLNPVLYAQKSGT
jgi:hypothetical protein